MGNEPTIGRLATTIVVTLIGMHGLAKAYEIAKRINEQILSQIKRQIMKHPDEWPSRIKQEVSGTLDQDVPPAPSI